MDRPTAATYLTNEYGTLATEVGFDSGASAAAYSTATDMALRQLGYQESDLATAVVGQPNIIGYLALLNYYTLKRFARELSIRVNVTVAGQISAMRSQAALQVKGLLDEAKVECQALGFAIEVQAITSGRFTLDFLEPTQGDF